MGHRHTLSINIYEDGTLNEHWLYILHMALGTYERFRIELHIPYGWKLEWIPNIYIYIYTWCAAC